MTINLVRPDVSTDLSLVEQNDISEINVDNYNNYDYKIINDSTLEELKNKVYEVLEGEFK